MFPTGSPKGHEGGRRIFYLVRNQIFFSILMVLTTAHGFPYYISLVEGLDYKKLFRSSDNFRILSSISEGQSKLRYAEGKWSIRQLVGHMTDHERIMAYRILRFSRKDETLLSGYDQEILVKNSRFDELTMKFLLNDFRTIRQATLNLMESLSAEQMQLKGKAWKFELTVEEFLKATIGHEVHHMRVIKERYLK